MVSSALWTVPLLWPVVNWPPEPWQSCSTYNDAPHRSAPYCYALHRNFPKQKRSWRPSNDSKLLQRSDNNVLHVQGALHWLLSCRPSRNSRYVLSRVLTWTSWRRHNQGTSWNIPCSVFINDSWLSGLKIKQGACTLHAANLRLQTHTQNMQYL